MRESILGLSDVPCEDIAVDGDHINTESLGNGVTAQNVVYSHGTYEGEPPDQIYTMCILLFFFFCSIAQAIILSAGRCFCILENISQSDLIRIHNMVSWINIRQQ